ncbi:MAG TPA: biotin/lipoyl-containing protein [Bryobacteraceae bacterium]|nr:biotin/lipoyl-containing protein [Bryobacteraceae bacterium]
MKRVLIGLGEEREVSLNGEAAELRVLEQGTALLVVNGNVHRVTHAGGRLLINGKEAHLSLANPRDRRRTGGGTSESGRRDVKAAMPGKVVKILVEPGQTVETGAGLLTLEAMKMQNEVRAGSAGTVATVGVKVGDTVASGQVLVTLE